MVALPKVPEHRQVWTERRRKPGASASDWSRTIAWVQLLTSVDVDGHDEVAALRKLEANLLEALADVRDLRKHHETENAALAEIAAIRQP